MESIRPKTLKEKVDALHPVILEQIVRILDSKILHYSDEGTILIVLDKTNYSLDTVNLSTFFSLMGIEGVPKILNRVDSLGILTTQIDKRVTVYRGSKILALITELGYKELTEVATLDRTTYKKITYIQPDDLTSNGSGNSDVGTDTIMTRPPEM